MPPLAEAKEHRSFLQTYLLRRPGEEIVDAATPCRSIDLASNPAPANTLAPQIING